MSRCSVVGRLRAFKPSSFLQIHWLQACRMTADSAAADCNSCAVIYTLLESACLHCLTENEQLAPGGNWRNGRGGRNVPAGSPLPRRRLLGIQPNSRLPNSSWKWFSGRLRGILNQFMSFWTPAAQKNLLHQFVLWLLVEREVCPSELVWKGSFLNSVLVGKILQWWLKKTKQTKPILLTAYLMFY